MLIDLLIIALVTAFVASRFFKFKLPTDTRPKAERKDWRKLLQQPNPLQPADETTQTKPLKDVTPATPAKSKPNRAELSKFSGLDQIKTLEESFTEADFLSGATAAHSYFYQNLAAQNTEALANLCTPKLLKQLDLQAPTVTIHGPTTASILEAKVTGKTAIITTQFTTTASMAGGPQHARTEHWVFARPLGSADPNWEIQSLQIKEGQA